MYEVAIKSLFTRIELFLMKNQHKAFVLNGKRMKGDTEESSDWTPKNVNGEPKSSAFKQLYQGVLK